MHSERSSLLGFIQTAHAGCDKYLSVGSVLLHVDPFHSWFMRKHSSTFVYTFTRYRWAWWCSVSSYQAGFGSAWAFLCGVCKLHVCTGFLSMNGLFNDGPACHDAQNLPLQGSQLSLHLSQMSFPAGGLQEGTPVSLFMKRHWSLYTSSSSGLFPPCFGFLIRF